MRIFSLLIVSLICINSVNAQTDSIKVPVKQDEPKKKHWYESIQLRGYAQVRYNRLLETNPDLKCDQCDKSIGENGGIFMRRLRIIFFGNVHERVYIYVQPDFASSASSTGLHFGQIRDAYFDLSLDKKKEFRLRFGQSKVPFGFENMQSSQNRLPLDRNDGLNSALSNERDLGVFFYWAPKKIRDRFSMLVSSGLKGSGDYGVLGLGVYNGQTANKPEGNDVPHIVGRLTYPFQIKKQIIEPAVQAYYGDYTMPSDLLSKNVKYNDNATYTDWRAAGTFVLYPQPFGLFAEYNIGEGPRYNPLTDSIETSPITGGYVTATYMIKLKKQMILPFVRAQYYSGGKKHELDARSYKVNEYEIGVEWQPHRNFELVVMYTISERTFEDHAKPSNTQAGQLLRIQVQFNY